MADHDKARILIVDDDKHLLTTLKDYLSFKGYDTTTAASGEAALTTLETLTADLIILDIGMPGMGGMGFLKRVSANGKADQTPILILTAKAIMEDFFAELDIAGFVAKPCSEKDLLRKVREILSRSTAAKSVKPRVEGCTLLVEDDPVVAGEIRRTFDAGPNNIKIETAQTAAAGIQQAVALKPNLILANEVLRGMNGNEMAGLIRQMPGLHNIPIMLYRKTLQAEGLLVFTHRLFGTRNSHLQSTDSRSLHDAVCGALRAEPTGTVT